MVGKAARVSVYKVGRRAYEFESKSPYNLLPYIIMVLGQLNITPRSINN